MISISPYGSRTPDVLYPSSPKNIESLLLEPSTWLDCAQQMDMFSNARSALWSCLRQLGLNEHDEVCIQTTSNGPYISSCVTKTIESICLWSRKITGSTKLVIIIHEFGFPYNKSNLCTLQRLGIPILEDCAYSVGSRINGAAVGCYGDFAIYSLPKYYPVQRGGILASRKISDGYPLNDDLSSSMGQRLSHAESIEIFKEISYDSAVQRQWNIMRRANWQYFAQRLAGSGVIPYFEVDSCAVPGVFVCSLPSSLNGQVLKSRFVNAGIEATEYYGHGGFYFPVHQFLSAAEIDVMLKLFGESQ